MRRFLLTLAFDAFALASCGPSTTNPTKPPPFDPMPQTEAMHATNEAYEKRKHLIEWQHQNVKWDQLPKYYAEDKEGLKKNCIRIFGPGTTLIDYRSDYRPDTGFLHNYGSCWTKK